MFSTSPSHAFGSTSSGSRVGCVFNLFTRRLLPCFVPFQKFLNDPVCLPIHSSVVPSRFTHSMSVKKMTRTKQKTHVSDVNLQFGFCRAVDSASVPSSPMLFPLRLLRVIPKISRNMLEMNETENSLQLSQLAVCALQGSRQRLCTFCANVIHRETVKRGSQN